jgi:hypothetical protein
MKTFKRKRPTAGPELCLVKASSAAAGRPSPSLRFLMKLYCTVEKLPTSGQPKHDRPRQSLTGGSPSKPTLDKALTGGRPRSLLGMHFLGSPPERLLHDRVSGQAKGS